MWLSVRLASSACLAQICQTAPFCACHSASSSWLAPVGRSQLPAVLPEPSLFLCVIHPTLLPSLLPAKTPLLVPSFMSNPCPPGLQAALRHPYYRYGYVAAVLFGLVGWAIATEEKERREPHAENAERDGKGSGGAG